MTFTRRDWRPFEQSGVELTGSFTATVDAVLSVGAVDEAITVTFTRAAMWGSLRACLRVPIFAGLKPCPT